MDDAVAVGQRLDRLELGVGAIRRALHHALAAQLAGGKGSGVVVGRMRHAECQRDGQRREAKEGVHEGSSK